MFNVLMTAIGLSAAVLAFGCSSTSSTSHADMKANSGQCACCASCCGESCKCDGCDCCKCEDCKGGCSNEACAHADCCKKA